MLALSVRQPSSAVSYLAGVLAGDGWLSSHSRHGRYGYLGLRVADIDFAESFGEAIALGFALPSPRVYFTGSCPC